MMTTTRIDILERLRREGLVLDGAMGSMLEDRRPLLPDYDCPERLVLTCGDVIRDIHRDYLRAGAQVVETCTFGATPHKLGMHGLDNRVREINTQAAVLAGQAVREFDGALVAGSMGPTGLLSIEKRTDFDDFHRNFLVQAEALLVGGVDILLLETCNDILETRAGVKACRDAMHRTGREAVLAVSLTVDANGRMLMGTPLETAALTLDHLGVDLIGVNCSLGPEGLWTVAAGLPGLVAAALLVMPNRGLPENVGGRAVYTLPPEEFAAQTARFRERGFHALGGCCGTNPDSIHCLRERLAEAGPPPPERPPRRPALTAIFDRLLLDEITRPVIIGERLNYFGSRRFRETVEAGDLDGVLALARRQVEGGAHLLDVCLATRDQQRQLELLATYLPPLGINVNRPLMVDTTEPQAMEAACRRIHGRSAINSCNLEDEDRCRRIMGLAKEYGQMLVCLPLAGDTLPREPERRLETALRLLDLAREEGLSPRDLMFDPLVLAIGTGRAEDRTGGIQTLATLELYRRHLADSYTVMGVSNISYGLPAAVRPLVNNALLGLATDRGLDFAIFNPAELAGPDSWPPEQWSRAEDLVLNRRADALDRVLQLAESIRPVTRPVDIPEMAGPPEEWLRQMLVHRRRDGFLELLREVLERGDPQRIVREVFLPAMREVGAMMEREGLPLPYVLESATMAQEGLAFLKERFDIGEVTTRGRIVLATVKGDVHDIGKNLVKMVLGHNGFDVRDLGTDVPAERIVAAARECRADVIGLSALLVSTSREMSRVVDLLASGGEAVPVMIGGAAVNRRYALELANRPETTPVYPVFYGSDAFQGLRLAEDLCDPVRRATLDEELVAACRRSENADHAAPASVGLTVTGPEYGTDVQSPAHSEDMSPDDLLQNFDFERSCRRRLLGGGRMDDGFYRRLIESGDELLEHIRAGGWIRPRWVAGVYPVLLEDEVILLRQPPRSYPVSLQPGLYPRLIRADEQPVLPLLTVTLGAEINDRVREYFDRGDFLRGYLLSTVGSALAETLAEAVTIRVLGDLGISRQKAVRYSPGYPVWPALSDQETLFVLLGVTERIGVTLSEGFQMVPEFSVSAGLLLRAADTC